MKTSTKTKTKTKTETTTILIVDDHPELRRLVRFTLDQPGYEMHEAGDGNTALAKHYSIHPDLIVLDIMMPGMDGFEVCREIRSNHPARPPCIIMLTAQHEHRIRQESEKVGADGFLTKPFSPVQLQQMVTDMGVQNVQ